MNEQRNDFLPPLPLPFLEEDAKRTEHCGVGMSTFWGEWRVFFWGWLILRWIKRCSSALVGLDWTPPTPRCGHVQSPQMNAWTNLRYVSWHMFSYIWQGRKGEFTLGLPFSVPAVCCVVFLHLKEPEGDISFDSQSRLLLFSLSSLTAVPTELIGQEVR